MSFARIADRNPRDRLISFRNPENFPRLLRHNSAHLVHRQAQLLRLYRQSRGSRPHVVKRMTIWLTVMFEFQFRHAQRDHWGAFRPALVELDKAIQHPLVIVGMILCPTMKYQGCPLYDEAAQRAASNKLRNFP